MLRNVNLINSSSLAAVTGSQLSNDSLSISKSADVVGVSNIQSDDGINLF